jgi:D-aminopeptidase
MIFVSGEAHACQEISELIPGIVTVAVKRGLSRRSALSWPSQKAREMIRAGVQEALKRRDQIEPLKIESPLLFRDERYEETWTEDSDNPDISIINPRLREVKADDIMDLLNKIYGYSKSYKASSLADG